MTLKQAFVVSVSFLQFNLSRTLRKALKHGVPFCITHRNRKTHVVFPMALMTNEVLAALGPHGESIKSCTACSPDLNSMMGDEE